jgi:hypothetical protein
MLKPKFRDHSGFPQHKCGAAGTANCSDRFLSEQRAAQNTRVSDMRALNALLTVAGFTATFAVLVLTSAILTATVHKAITSISLASIGG